MKLITNEQELEKTLLRIDALWDAKPGSEERDELEILSLLVEKYEDKHYPIPASNPIEAIKFLMDQNGLKRKDLAPYIGSSGRVSEILNGKRELSLTMIKKLHQQFHIPYESLIS